MLDAHRLAARRTDRGPVDTFDSIYSIPGAMDSFYEVGTVLPLAAYFAAPHNDPASVWPGRSRTPARYAKLSHCDSSVLQETPGPLRWTPSAHRPLMTPNLGGGLHYTELVITPSTHSRPGKRGPP